MGTLAQPFTSLNENDNFIAGAYYAMTLLINEDHIPIVRTHLEPSKDCSSVSITCYA